MGKQNKITTREILILASSYNKKLLFFDVEPISMMNRPEPARPDLARPGPAMTLFDGLFLKYVKTHELETLI